MMILIQFNKNFITGILVMANLQILSQFKGNKSCITDAIMTKLNVNSHIMTIHHDFKFHEIPFVCCLVLTQFVDLQVIQGQ